MAKIEWTKISNLNLAKAVREAGYDISIFDHYSQVTKEEAKKSSIKQILSVISDEFDQKTSRNIKQIEKGVYVICISKPFVIQYEKGRSKVIYIGQGKVLSRLKSHFERSLFRFMRSLAGTNFDLYISEPKKSGGGVAKLYYKHIEFLLLERFSQKFGGKEGAERFPLLNNNAGSKKNLQPDDGWKLPLSMRGEKRRWVLSKTDNWDFEELG